MKLLTKAIIKRLPLIYKADDDTVVAVRLFAPWSNYTWYIWEYDPENRLGFGLTVGLEKELGYVDFSELEAIVGPAGLKIERDLYYKPETVPELLKRVGYRGYAVDDEEAAEVDAPSKGVPGSQKSPFGPF